MRLAVVADIHGNLDALQAVLPDLLRQSPDLVVNLGDCLSGPLWPLETADLLIDLNWLTIRGNHDRWLTTPPDPIGAWEAEALPRLTPAHHTWLAALPPTATIDNIFLCHATPQDDLTYWLDAPLSTGEMVRADLTQIADRAGDLPQSLLLCGHTHIARAVRLLDGRMIVNPGSIGCPGYTDDSPWPHRACAGTPYAAYAVLDRTPHGWAVAHRQIPYDTTRAVARAHADPDWSAALATGWIPAPQSWISM
ncbi:MAG: metallophosphoesterase family protein [bacterium]